ncbi:MAG: hypothetical protein AAF328_06930 [Planctomycetota bacterium]
MSGPDFSPPLPDSQAQQLAQTGESIQVVKGSVLVSQTTDEHTVEFDPDGPGGLPPSTRKETRTQTQTESQTDTQSQSPSVGFPPYDACAKDRWWGLCVKSGLIVLLGVTCVLLVLTLLSIEEGQIASSNNLMVIWLAILIGLVTCLMAFTPRGRDYLWLPVRDNPFVSPEVAAAVLTLIVGGVIVNGAINKAEDRRQNRESQMEDRRQDRQLFMEDQRLNRELYVAKFNADSALVRQFADRAQQVLFHSFNARMINEFLVSEEADRVRKGEVKQDDIVSGPFNLKTQTYRQIVQAEQEALQQSVAAGSLLGMLTQLRVAFITDSKRGEDANELDVLLTGFRERFETFREPRNETSGGSIREARRIVRNEYESLQADYVATLKILYQMLIDERNQSNSSRN